MRRHKLWAATKVKCNCRGNLAFRLCVGAISSSLTTQAHLLVCRDSQLDARGPLGNYSNCGNRSERRHRRDKLPRRSQFANVWAGQPCCIVFTFIQTKTSEKPKSARSNEVTGWKTSACALVAQFGQRTIQLNSVDAGRVVRCATTLSARHATRSIFLSPCRRASITKHPHKWMEDEINGDTFRSEIGLLGEDCEMKTSKLNIRLYLSMSLMSNARFEALSSSRWIGDSISNARSPKQISSSINCIVSFAESSIDLSHFMCLFYYFRPLFYYCRFCPSVDSFLSTSIDGIISLHSYFD